MFLFRYSLLLTYYFGFVVGRVYSKSTAQATFIDILTLTVTCNDNIYAVRLPCIATWLISWTKTWPSRCFICIISMISATTLLNLYAELSECCTNRKRSVWVNLRTQYLCPTATALRRRHIKPRPHWRVAEIGDYTVAVNDDYIVAESPFSATVVSVTLYSRRFRRQYPTNYTIIVVTRRRLYLVYHYSLRCSAWPWQHLSMLCAVDTDYQTEDRQQSVRERFSRFIQIVRL